MPIPVGTYAQMQAMALPGDQLYFWDKNPFAYTIEGITGGPSHVIMVAQLPPFSAQLFELEALIGFGCRILPLSHYASYTSRMLLCRRAVTPEDITKAIGVGLEALGRQYEVEEEIQIALEKIAPWIHTDKTDNKLFCSGYLEYMYQVTSKPYAKPPNGNATPAWCLDDKDTQPLLWVN
jgi:hypothetical protein